MQKDTCHNCGRETDGAVKITQIRGNQKTMVTLCRSCASAMGFHNPLDQMPFPLAKILGSFIEESVMSETQPAQEISCPTCEMTFAQFSQQGRFGCGDCYETFRPQLETILRKIHGHCVHRGKTPGEESTDQVSVAEQERLEAEYRMAIEREEFERAADLRDRLRDIRAQLQAHMSEQNND